MKRFPTILLAVAVSLLVTAGTAWTLGQLPPSGAQVLNQGLNGVAVTPSDTTVLIQTRALFNGNSTACNIAVVFAQGGGPFTFQNVQIGQLLPLSVVKVMNTNTTCSSIIALY